MARILITSAIPYINGVKHLGNLIGSQLPADLYARYNRLRGNEVMFICATDEHGTPAELAAAKAKQPIEQFCAEMHKVQIKLSEGFNLSFDHFGRSSSDENKKLTQYFAGKLNENGFIKEVNEEQIYSNADKRFLPDRYVEGICPECNYENARGDQCENCTKQLNPIELIQPRSAISGSEDLEIRKTKHLYLLQSKLKDELDRWIKSKTDWPILTTSIAQKWLHDGDGLQDRGITRDLNWGVPVKDGDKEWPGMEDKVFYVWFDAPIEYIAATVEYTNKLKLGDSAWERWWRTDKGADDVHYVQFMGKDNVPFHTLSFPSTLIGSGDPWKLVDYIKSFNYLNYDGGQFSTSQGRGVFMNQALEILPSDYWRWWLLSHVPENSDSEFTWENFQSSINKDLADVLGNFVSRVTKFCRSKFGESIPNGKLDHAVQQNLVNDLQKQVDNYQAHMEALEIRKAAYELRKIWVAGNEFLQKTEPWAQFKTDPKASAGILQVAINLIRIYAILSEPFIPETSRKLMESLNCDDWEWPRNVDLGLRKLPSKHSFSVRDVLFKKISDDERDAMQEKFSGTRN